jgi:AsmA protein
MRALKFTGAAIAAVIVLVAVLLFVVGIPSGFLTSTIQDRVERETGYRIVISGATRLGLWPSLNMTLHDIAVPNTGDQQPADRLTLRRAEFDISFASLFSGHPQVTRVAIDHPVLHIPLRRERTRAPSPSMPAPSSPANADSSGPDHVTITNGAIVFANVRDHVEHRIESINADFRLDSDRKIKITGGARAADSPLKFEIRATAPAPPLGRQNIPVDFKFDAPAFLEAPLSAKAEVRLNGSIVMINGLTGKIGDDEFNGWASADLTSKPQWKLDLDFQRFVIGTAEAASTPGSTAWSNAPIDVNRLNYVDFQLRISAADLRMGGVVFAPAAIDATLANGVLRATFSHLGLYGGQADGEFSIDAAVDTPNYTLRSDLHDVRALPLLKSLAGFEKVDGKMQAKLAVRASGVSQSAIMSSLDGTASANFQDGSIQGLNVAKMIRSLTSSTQSGWQESSDQTTDLTQLSASFRLEQGQATTRDFALAGPLVRMTGAGTVNVGAKSLAFRVEPKLVMSVEGQGSASNPIGLGVPVMVEGPWSAPRIYPDVAGMLDNPDGAYAKLKEMGKGLFGPAGGASDARGGMLGDTLGTMIQGLRRDPNAPASRPSAPGDTPPIESGAAPPPPDSNPVSGILKNLFNR